MSDMIRVEVPLSEGQVKKMRKAIKTLTPVSLRLSSDQLGAKGGIPILITKSQYNKMRKSLNSGKGMILKISMTQMRKLKKDGGILPFIVPAVIAGATALATGALSAVGGYATTKGLEAIENAVSGKKGKGLFPPGTSGGDIYVPSHGAIVVGAGNKKKGKGLFPQGVKP